MTALEKLERMETCARCMTGECDLGYDAPLCCGSCSEYVGIWHDDRGADGSTGKSSVQIHVPAADLWSFYRQNIGRCQKEMVLIAENTDTRYAVYVTDDDGTLMLSVCKGEGAPEYEEYALNAADCANSAKKLFLRYLIPFTVVNGRVATHDELLNDQDEEEQDDTRQDIEDEIYEREDELDLAMKDFLSVVLREPDIDSIVAEYGQDFINEALDDILSYLAKEQAIDIFRPMFIEDEAAGGEVYVQFPYESEYTYPKDDEEDDDD